MSSYNLDLVFWQFSQAAVQSIHAQSSETEEWMAQNRIKYPLGSKGSGLKG